MNEMTQDQIVAATRSGPEHRLRCARCRLGIACIPMKQHLRYRSVYEDHQAPSQNVAIPMTFGREILP